jgi:hypothetical protein
MDTKAHAQQLLHDFGKTLTVGPLTLDERTQSCVLIFDEQLLVHIEHDDSTRRLVLSAYLHELPETGAEPLLRELLAANLYWHRTRGATLGLEEGTGGVILTYGHLVADLDAPRFETMVENFVHQAEHWKHRLQAAAQAAIPGDAPRDPSGAPVLFG